MHQLSCDSVTIRECFTKCMDRVILPFSVPTSQTTPEFSEVSKGLRNHDDKTGVALSKAHQMEAQQLMGEGYTYGCW